MKERVYLCIYIVKGSDETKELGWVGVLVGGVGVEGVGIVLISSRMDETSVGLRLGPKSHAESCIHMALNKCLYKSIHERRLRFNINLTDLFIKCEVNFFILKKILIIWHKTLQPLKDKLKCQLQLCCLYSLHFKIEVKHKELFQNSYLLR